MAKPIALLEQVSEALEELQQALTDVARDVEEMRSLLPAVTRFVNGVLDAILMSSGEEKEDASGLTDDMDIEIDFGGNNESENALI